MIRFYTLIITFLAVLLTGSCSSEKKEQENVPPTETEIATERVRPASQGGTSAAYFKYTNELEVADTLLSAQSPAAGMAQVHESYESEEGMMGMQEVESLILQPGQTVPFKQGGLHIMMMQLTRDLEPGDSVQVILDWARAGEISKSIPVKNTN